MENVTRLLLPDVAEALRTDASSVVQLTEELHAADLADLATQLDVDLALTLVSVLPVANAIDLFEEIEPGLRVELFTASAKQDFERAVKLSEEMASDERADLFGFLSHDLKTALLDRMERAESRDVRQLLTYPEGTAGALMTTEFVTLDSEETVGRAIEVVRQSASEMETINDAYAVDSHNILLGAVSLRDLVLAPITRKIDDIMEPNTISIDVNTHQEEVVRLIAKYDLFAIPVIDRARRIVGIITVDDVVDVIEEEATEDVQRLGAVEPLEGAYLQTTFWGFVHKRAPWLIILFAGGFLTSAAMKHIELEFDKVRPLLWFVPLIISAGGNAGSQSAALVIRALAVGEIQPGQFAKIIGRELAVGLALGVLLAVFGVGRALTWDATQTVAIVQTVSLSIVAVVAVGATLGSAFPLLLGRLGMDPAVSSTPFIASVSDVIGLVIYFAIASALVF